MGTDTIIRTWARLLSRLGDGWGRIARRTDEYAAGYTYDRCPMLGNGLMAVIRVNVSQAVAIEAREGVVVNGS